MKQDLSYLNKIFSKKTLFQLIQKTKNTEELNLKLNELYKEYQLLAKCYRNEYFFKNLLINTLIYKQSNPKSSIALTEIPIATSIVDLIVLSDNAIVFEIKTELDSLIRLESQLQNYYKAFPNVVVITTKEIATKLLKKYKNTTIGIYFVNTDNHITILKDYQSDFNNLEPKVMYNILRKGERDSILLNYFKSLPEVSQIDYYQERLKQFITLNKRLVYFDFIELLKQRKINSEYYSSLSQFPEFLRYLAYFSKFSKSELANLKRLFKL